MQQYFIKQKLENPITITDKETLKHMFAVMRLSTDDEVVLVFEDGIKRLARVMDSERHEFELVKDLDENAELPVEVTIAMGFPKGDKLDLVAQKGTEQTSGHIQQTGQWSNGTRKNSPNVKRSLRKSSKEPLSRVNATTFLVCNSLQLRTISCKNLHNLTLFWWLMRSLQRQESTRYLRTLSNN